MLDFFILNSAKNMNASRFATFSTFTSPFVLGHVLSSRKQTSSYE